MDGSRNRSESFQFLSSEYLVASFCIYLSSYMLLNHPCVALKNAFFHIVSGGDSTLLSHMILSCLLGKTTMAASLWILVQEALKPAGHLKKS